MLEKCITCKKEFELADIVYSDDGNSLCNSCYDDNCSKCHEHTAEIETYSGDYWCVSCYSGAIDSAYDFMMEK